MLRIVSKKDSKKRILLKQRSEMRKIRRRKKYLQKKHSKRISKLETASNLVIDLNSGNIYHKVTLPSNLTINNLEGAIRFVNDISSRVNKDKYLRPIYFDLSSIVQIDYVGLCFMLSVANKFLGRGISSKGNYPKDVSAKQFIFDSGFCEMVSTNVRRINNRIPKNILYMIGGSSIDNVKIGNSIKETVYRLTGIKEHYAPVYENMLEICANSVEHGNNLTSDKNWLVSISFNDGEALFVLMDMGEGILKTLKRKTKELFVDLLSFKTAGDVLNGVFNKKYQSSTGEINRHKGLPNILSSFLNGYISNLEVITNKVNYNFSTNSYASLKNEFKGTAFMWKITKVNIAKYKDEN